MMNFDNHKYGMTGENMAVTFLESKGFKILLQNFRFGKYGEIDIIAYNNEVTVFIE